MKLLSWVIALGCVGAFVSCQSSVREVATPAPTEANARVSGKPLPVLKRGYGVYMTHCSECHEHRLPDTVTFSEWQGHIDTMADLAGLSKEEEEDLQHYLGELSDR